MFFGPLIRLARERRRMTLEEVCAGTGIASSTLANWETARYLPPDDAGIEAKLAAALGIAAGEIRDAGRRSRGERVG
jgi:transcriptional regulator with XRE-family HTH domain